MRKDVQGIVYLLCFRDPVTQQHKAYRHAGHYIGFTENLEQRLAEHKSGGGANLIRVIVQAGLTFTCVQTWNGSRKLEKLLKGRHSAYSLCPHCRAEFNIRRREKQKAKVDKGIEPG